MHSLSKVAASARVGGRVLEVGYGMGISARYLAQEGVATHVVAEPNRAVYDAALHTHARAFADQLAFCPVLGFWQEVTPLLVRASARSLARLATAHHLAARPLT